MASILEAKENGPYLVEGPVKVTVGGGEEQTVERPVIALCRCGGSQNKPFCDGTHGRAGFQAAGAKFSPR